MSASCGFSDGRRAERGACLRWNISETADVHELRGLVGECIVARTTLELTTSASGRVALLRGSVDERFRGRGFGTMMLRWAAAVAGGFEGSRRLRCGSILSMPQMTLLHSSNPAATNWL